MTNQTLSDKRYTFNMENTIIFYERDVRESLKKVVDKMNGNIQEINKNLEMHKSYNCSDNNEFHQDRIRVLEGQLKCIKLDLEILKSQFGDKLI